MKTMVPPAPPLFIGLADDGGSERLRLRLHQISLTAVTVGLTAWCVTLGLIPAVLSLCVAKHVLVAILVMGLGVDAPRPAAHES
jgi:hypothetical protein